MVSLKGKTYEEIMGKEKAIVLKGKRRNAKLGTTLSQITKDKISLANQGKTRFDEVKDKQSQRMKGESNPMYGKRGILSPHYGKKRPEHSKFLVDYYKTHKHQCLGRKNTEESNDKRSRKLKGRILTKEHKENLSKALKGRVFSDETRYKMKVVQSNRSDEWNANISKSKKGKPNPKVSASLKKLYRDGKIEISGCAKLSKESNFSDGENNPNFKGWKSREPYGKAWSPKLKNKIRSRDNFTCQECGFAEKQLGYSLSVHHIDYNKQNNHPSNLISLCMSCHLQTNFKREDWQTYFQNKLSKREIC